MSDQSDIRETPAAVRDITATRIAEMDAAVEDLHPQRYKTSVRHQHNSWSTPLDTSLPHTPLDVESKPSNNDVRLRRASFGGNDGKGTPFFSSLTKQKRTDAAWYQSSFDEQAPVYGPIEKIYRKWVTGRSVPNTYGDIKRGEYSHPHTALFSPPK